ncbi:alpha/beta hydrolase [Nocardia bovistercoris]|uniref:alpha/beta hydrolase n=1 Tax=Nocardia bovistercoris TaxID=2785916 RepID=UPI001E32F93A|nr:alpha/beta hydrolase [Nocardia bovistercoris]
MGLAAGGLAIAALVRRGSSAFHSDLRYAAAFLPGAAITPLTLPVIRKLGSRVPTLPGVEVVDIDANVSVRVHRPAGLDTPAPALLWIHGGGYLIGSAAQDDQLCRRFAEKLGVVVASVEYRLAPEHPYPAPLDDCYAAWSWLARQPEVDPDRLVVGGASAGGGLAAATVLAARDRGAVLPILQLLVYPMLDDRTADRFELESPLHRLWNRSANRYGWNSYLGAADPDTAVPARNPDLSGLPPAWIGVGSLDLFHDEDLEYARRLRAAGVACEVVEVPGAFHGFDLVLPAARVSRTFFDDQCEAVRAALAPR